MMSTLSLTPVKQQNRIYLLDVFRGLAILGILMVNLPLMYQPVTSFLLGSQSDSSWLNDFSQGFINFFFEGKFYVIFSMLFGYGFWLFMNKKMNDGRNMIPVYGRRIFFLFLFGVLHIYLLWAGDILVYYSVFGIILLLFKNVSDKGLIKWAVVIGAIPGVLSLLGALMVGLASSDPAVDAEIKAGFAQSSAHIKEFNLKASEVYASGSFSDIVQIRLSEYRKLLPGLLTFYPVVLSMFLVGVWSARRKIISEYDKHISLFKRVFWWSLVVGLLSSTFFAISYRYAVPTNMGKWEAINALTHTLGGVFLGLCYLSGIVLLYAAGKINKLIKLLAPVGQMALTNYLLHSIVAIILFHPYGFGLFGRVELWQGILLTLLIFTLQIPFSFYWLKTFKYGPFEWVWRSFTYLKPQPLSSTGSDTSNTGH